MSLQKLSKSQVWVYSYIVNFYFYNNTSINLVPYEYTKILDYFSALSVYVYEDQTSRLVSLSGAKWGQTKGQSLVPIERQRHQSFLALPACRSPVTWLTCLVQSACPRRTVDKLLYLWGPEMKWCRIIVISGIRLWLDTDPHPLLH